MLVIYEIVGNTGAIPITFNHHLGYKNLCRGEVTFEYMVFLSSFYFCLFLDALTMTKNAPKRNIEPSSRSALVCPISGKKRKANRFRQCFVLNKVTIKTVFVFVIGNSSTILLKSFLFGRL